MNARPQAIGAARAARSTKDGEGLASWLEAAGDDAHDSLCLVDLLAERLAQSTRAWPREQEMAWYELARQRQVSAIEAALQPLAQGAFPLSAVDWALLQKILRQCRLARDRFERLHATLSADAPPIAPDGIPGASNELRDVLALARALDLQARLLRLQLLHRVDVAVADWEALARLARPLRSSSFMDETLPDPASPSRSMSARGLIVYPLLLAAAEPDRRDQAELELIDRLARDWAGKVGLRLDENARLRENRLGPTLLLGEHHSVRLDTHRIVRRLGERIEVLQRAGTQAALRLPRGLTRERCLRLLRELHDDWGPAYRPSRWPTGLAEPVLVRFDPPTAASPASADAGALATRASPEGPLAAPAAASSRAYVYGRDEHNTLIRRAKGLDAMGREAALAWMQDGDEATVVGRDADRCVIERVALHPVKAGMLVALTDAESPAASAAEVSRAYRATGSAERAGDDERDDQLRLGWVTHRKQGARRADGVRWQRLQLTLWPVEARWVSVRLEPHAYFEDAFLLPAFDGDPASLITSPGRARDGETALLRLPRRELSVAFGALLQRGSGFERVALVAPGD